MATFISHISALQLLLSSGTPQRRVFGLKSAAFSPSRAKPKPGKHPDAKIIADLGFPDGIVTDTLHINVADKAALSKFYLLTYHVWPAPERGSYLRIDNEYYVQTPEACFAQLAGELPLSQLTELAMVLCGTFAPQPHNQPTRYDVEPLSTPKQLQSYVARLKGKRGLDNARIAAKLASSGAGSAVEAKIAAALALSTQQGGFGIPALLNQEIVLTDAARGAGHVEKRRPDFYWPKYKVALEYDSNEFHESDSQAAADTYRYNEIGAMGITFLVARPRDIRNQLAFETLMTQLFEAMGKSQKSTVRELPLKRARLFNELFGSEKWSPMDKPHAS